MRADTRVRTGFSGTSKQWLNGAVSWHDQASCRDADPELFYTPDTHDMARYFSQKQEAIAICEQCPVMEQCREYAIEAGEQLGIWGGTTPRDREKIRKGRRTEVAA